MALTIAQVEHAIKKTAGNISACARELGVTRQTVYNKIEQHADLKQLLTDTREELVDIAESALRREVIGGNTAAIIFTLKTQGRKRGYIEKVDLNLTSEVQAMLPQLIKEIESAGLEASDVFNAMLAQLASVDADSE